MTSSDGKSGVDLLRVAAHLRHRVAHGGEVDHAGDAGEILQHDARRVERDLGVRRRSRSPVGEPHHVFGFDRHPVLVAEQILEQDAERKRQLGDVFARARGELGQAEKRVSFPVDDEL